MGESRRKSQALKLIEEGKDEGRVVTFALDGPDFTITDIDRDQLLSNGVDPYADPQRLRPPADESTLPARALRSLLWGLINAKFPTNPQSGQGQMTRKDRKLFAVWQEAVEDESPLRTEIPLKALEWIYAIACEDRLPLRPSLAGWCERFIDYSEQLIKASKQAAPA
jgi:hypothetical protein